MALDVMHSSGQDQYALMGMTTLLEAMLADCLPIDFALLSLTRVVVYGMLMQYISHRH